MFEDLTAQPHSSWSPEQINAFKARRTIYQEKTKEAFPIDDRFSDLLIFPQEFKKMNLDAKSGEDKS